MTSRFTKKAQNSLNKALFYAREMGHDYIGTEHLLLGLLTETDSIAYKALTASGVTLEQTRAMIEKAAGTGAPSAVNAGDMTPRTKTVIESSAQRSVSLGHSYIGTEHLLWGLISEGEGVAAKALETNGLTADKVEKKIDVFVGTGKPLEKISTGFTPRTKSVLERSYAEAMRLGHGYIGTEHILISLLREGESLAVRILSDSGINIQKLYNRSVFNRFNKPLFKKMLA